MNEYYKFQSPDGDFVYSDWSTLLLLEREFGVFQSPDGDFVYSDSLTRS